MYLTKNPSLKLSPQSDPQHKDTVQQQTLGNGETDFQNYHIIRFKCSVFKKKNHKAYKERAKYYTFKETKEMDIICASASIDIKFTRQRLENNCLKDAQRLREHMDIDRETTYEQNENINKEREIIKRKPKKVWSLHTIAEMKNTLYGVKSRTK